MALDYTDKAALIDLINSEVVLINQVSKRPLTVKFNDYSAQVLLDSNMKVFEGDLVQVFNKLTDLRLKTINI
jgi:hypothetical protein